MSETALSFPSHPAAPFAAWLADLGAAGAAAWTTFRRRRGERLALARARHLGPRLLADMGIAEAVPPRAIGGWDDMAVNGMLIRRR